MKRYKFSVSLSLWEAVNTLWIAYLVIQGNGKKGGVAEQF